MKVVLDCLVLALVYQTWVAFASQKASFGTVLRLRSCGSTASREMLRHVAREAGVDQDLVESPGPSGWQERSSGL